MSNDIKKLLGESISAETAEALQAIVDKTINENDAKLKTIQEENTALHEAINLTEEKHKAEIEHLKEKAEEYAEQVKQEAVDLTLAEAKVQLEEKEAFLIEKAEEYGEKLKADHDAEIEYLKEKAEEYGAFLIEKAESYGEFLIEKADEYGEFLIEKADEYGDSVETKCLAEAKEEIDAFKSEHEELFARLDEQTRMKSVFENMKSLLESSGFTVDESDVYEKSQADLRASRREIRELKSKLVEQKTELKTLKIEKLTEEFAGDDLTLADKERIKKAAQYTQCSDESDLNQVVKTLVENSLLNKNTQRQTNVINELDTKNLNRKTSGWKDRLI